jgi:hypothetical protein
MSLLALEYKVLDKLLELLSMFHSVLLMLQMVDQNRSYRFSVILSDFAWLIGFVATILSYKILTFIMMMKNEFDCNKC